MFRKLKIAMAAALLAAMTIPLVSTSSNAGNESYSDSYYHKHDNHGW